MIEHHLTHFADRRRQFAKALGTRTAAIVWASESVLRNADTEHPFRQDSNFYYLTGLLEPHCVLVFAPSGSFFDPPPAEDKIDEPDPNEVTCTLSLFVPKPNKLREKWDGPRLTPEAAKAACGADRVFFTDDLPKKLGELFRGHHSVVHLLGHPKHDATVIGAIARARGLAGRGKALYPTHVVSSVETLSELRLKKTPLELEWMKAAAAVSVKAHEHAMKLARAGHFEYELDAAILDTFRKDNGVPAYENIVASGANATYLHYRANNRQIQSGDLILIDAGCELATYASDITRTFPVSGLFLEPQRVVYQKVLDVQTACIEQAKAGVTIEDLQQTAVKMFTDALISWGILKGPASELIAKNEYKRYYPHRIGHWLGLDVHDAGHYMLFEDSAPKGAQHRPLENGHVFTIEPGLYFPPDDESVPADFRGIGVRIEDDIAITASGREVLTNALIREIADIERFMART